MPKAVLLGTRTTNRPGMETSWVSRAPLAPMGFLVTWHRMVWPGLSSCSIRGWPVERPRLDVLGVVADVPVVEHGVLRGADVDEGGLHARQHVLDPAPVDVAVDLGGVVGGPGDVVLHQGAALEQGDLGRLGTHVDADHVATDGLAPALAAPRDCRVGPARWRRARRHPLRDDLTGSSTAPRRPAPRPPPGRPPP